jgi:hypothetical protein
VESGQAARRNCFLKKMSEVRKTITSGVVKTITDGSFLSLQKRTRVGVAAKGDSGGPGRGAGAGNPSLFRGVLTACAVFRFGAEYVILTVDAMSHERTPT